jgi:hypothetical protein
MQKNTARRAIGAPFSLRRLASGDVVAQNGGMPYRIDSDQHAC